MKKTILSFAIVLTPLISQGFDLKCEYGFSGVAMGNIKFSVDNKNQPSEYAEVSLFFAPMKKMPITNETPNAGEFLRMTIAKDDPTSELFIVVKNPEGNTIKSVLHNPGAPAGAKELQGTCTRLN